MPLFLDLKISLSTGNLDLERTSPRAYVGTVLYLSNNSIPFYFHKAVKPLSDLLFTILNLSREFL